MPDQLGRNVVARALDPIFDWATSRLYGNRGEHLHWRALRESGAQAVLDALHDAGFAVVPMNAPFVPSVSTKYVSPFNYEMRLEVEVEPGVHATTIQYDARWVSYGPVHLREELGRRLARQISTRFEDQLREKVAPLVWHADLQPKEPEDA